MVEGLVALDALGIRTLELDRTGLLLAIEAMERSGLTAYDAAYVALASSTDAELATLDRRLARAAGVSGTGVDRDPPARPSGISSAAAGRHIAELRRQAQLTPLSVEK